MHSNNAHLVHQEAAASAGLIYVTDGLPGITRKRSGKGWSFYKPNGQRIAAAGERQRILSLAIPPAWTDVWICPNPKGHIQVTARDAKGRKQYRYHAVYREARDQSKFRHIFELSEVLPRIREQAEKDLRACEHSREQVLATAVHLLDKTLIRVGNEDYAKNNKSFGLTTLRAKHVKVDGADVRFSFRGKSGVQHALSVRDRRIAKIIQSCQDLPGQELFQYKEGEGAEKRRITITSDDVNAYLQEIAGTHITAKDFRTWGGTMHAGAVLRDSEPMAATKRDATRAVNAALDQVAERLGNTRTVCRKYYVHPALVAAYMEVDAPRERRVAKKPEEMPDTAKPGKRGSAALRRDEVAILQFLHELDRAGLA